MLESGQILCINLRRRDAASFSFIPTAPSHNRLVFQIVQQVRFHDILHEPIIPKRHVLSWAVEHHQAACVCERKGSVL